MEKDQVTFALQASLEGAPVPEVQLLVSVASKGDISDITLWRKYDGTFYRKQRWTWKTGLLRHQDADMIGLGVGDCTYNLLVNLFGVVESLDDLVP